MSKLFNLFLVINKEIKITLEIHKITIQEKNNFINKEIKKEVDNMGINLY